MPSGVRVRVPPSAHSVELLAPLAVDRAPESAYFAVARDEKGVRLLLLSTAARIHGFEFATANSKAACDPACSSRLVKQALLRCRN